jgi:hypothetical protein
MQDDETMLKRTFKLKTSTFAILSERDQRSVVTIPAQSLVTLIVGDPDGDGFVKIRYRDQILLMFLPNADPHSESHSS